MSGPTYGRLAYEAKNFALIFGKEATFEDGITIDSGGLTLTAGGLAITAGGLTVTAGGLTVTAGGLAVTDGGITLADDAISIATGAAAAAVALRFGATATEGLEVKVIDETVTLTNAVEDDLTETLPAGAVVLSAQLNLETAVTGDASGDDGLDLVGLGTTADPDLLTITSALTKNAKADTIPDWAVLASETTITIKAVDDGGAAVTEKFVAGGIVRARIVYAVPNSLDDAS